VSAKMSASEHVSENVAQIGAWRRGKRTTLGVAREVPKVDGGAAGLLVLEFGELRHHPRAEEEVATVQSIWPQPSLPKKYTTRTGLLGYGTP
jgi:hypothetical protein